ncbi:hypothetical protein ACEYW6_26770 [Nostoc sp. UIC 10607]
MQLKSGSAASKGGSSPKDGIPSLRLGTRQYLKAASRLAFTFS